MAQTFEGPPIEPMDREDWWVAVMPLLCVVGVACFVAVYHQVPHVMLWGYVGGGAMVGLCTVAFFMRRKEAHGCDDPHFDHTVNRGPWDHYQ